MYIFSLDTFNELEAVFISCLLFQAAKALGRDFKVLVLKVMFKI